MPASPYQEIRDPIHVFVRLDDDELKVLDSPPVQRLRRIHQLAMSYLVYPGATHRRFEHSLGVMELAGRVFDVVTHEANLLDAVRSEIGSELLNPDKKMYWRKALRVAALCHDLGHLPFSHAAEEELMPDGRTHEHVSAELILGDEMQTIWESMRPQLNAEDIAKLAVGEAKMAQIRPDLDFGTWESLLSEIISSDTLGVDRMDYLLRDSHHVGVEYGRFDHHRLIDTMRILPTSQRATEPTLGTTDGGIHAAESLLLARYSMFMQVYFHRTRVAYDCLLKDFLGGWLPKGKFPSDLEALQSMTDDAVLQAISEQSSEDGKAHEVAAHRIMNRGHFRLLYKETPVDLSELASSARQDPAKEVFVEAEARYGADNVRHEANTPSQSDYHFPVLESDRDVVSSKTVSESLNHIPVARFGFVFVAPELYELAREWLNKSRSATP